MYKHERDAEVADNQWVAPHGVGTVAATTGEEYSTLVLVAAFVPEWEFNLGVTHYVPRQHLWN